MPNAEEIYLTLRKASQKLINLGYGLIKVAEYFFYNPGQSILQKSKKQVIVFFTFLVLTVTMLAIKDFLRFWNLVEEKEKAKVWIEAVKTIATISGGIFVIWNIKLTQERLITERFSKAVEHLGDDKLEVRLGGIYALERIAKDSEKDHWTIMEVLTSFVQEKSPIQQNKNFQQEETRKISTDVQAALTVIARRDSTKDPEDKHLDLSCANLSGAKLRKANFRYANFSGANLSQAILRYANLSGANLSGANLENTDLFMTVNLTPGQVKSANHWETATYSENFCTALGLLPEFAIDDRDN
ncbi:pentapeptide repeat-containing protein [Calothrix sp. NIES-2098]|uniref:pentapeptide repeat-containing protein n=1 Tax=Calothrix sp. NIES-2098 TaxID=1954171 RepID=UPI000B608D42|nr:pentapeptide repeat-containing protein [Calothrix sp. NIES-2098]